MQNWSYLVPSKVKLFTWRAIKHPIFSKLEISKRNIITNPKFMLCNFLEEDSNHHLINYEKAMRVWSVISTCCKLPQYLVGNIGDLLKFIDSWPNQTTTGVQYIFPSRKYFIT